MSYAATAALCLACGNTSKQGFGQIRHQQGCPLATKQKGKL